MLQYLIILTSIISGGYFAWAQFSEDAYVVKTVHVFPAEITAEGWNNAETLTFQNLEEYSLYQDFNAINSATLKKNLSVTTKLERTEEPVSVEELVSDELDTSDGVTDDQSDDSAAVDEGGAGDDSEVATETDSTTTASTSGIDESQDEPVVESAVSDFEFGFTESEISEEALPLEHSVSTVTVPSEVNAGADLPESTETETSTTTVLRQVTSLFRLAMETVTTFATSSADTDNETDVQNESETEADLSIAQDSGTEAEEVEVQVETEDDEEVADGETAETEVSVSDVAEEGGVATSTSNDVSTETEADVTEDVVAEVTAASSTRDEVEVEGGEDADVLTEQSSSTAPLTDREEQVDFENDCVDDCVPYVINLNNFAFPLDAGVELNGAQLRMSFAAKKKATRERMPVFEVEYATNGNGWEAGGIILIDDEVSNSVNGGYYLFALPGVTDQASLNTLQVRLVYEDNPELVDDLFVESVWLELFTIEPPEDNLVTPLALLLADDGFESEVLVGDELELPNGEVVEFTFTDDNSNENLIIKSNSKTYQGVSEAETYFSVTNNSNRADEVQLQAYFPNGVGEVESLQIFNQNKPRQTVVPEYRPFVYHCDAGWEFLGDVSADSITELSSQLSKEDENEDGGESAVSEEVVEGVEGGEDKYVTEPVFGVPTSTATTVPGVELGETVSNTTTTVLKRLSGLARLLQFSTTTDTTSSIVEVEATDQDQNIDGEVSREASVADESLVAGYSCRNTSIVRQCDELDGDNTSCRVNQVLIDEHEMTKYAPGWDVVTPATAALPAPGLLDRAASLVGFGPQRKEVPGSFEVRAHTDETFTIQPGETLYFKMDISFPAFTSGEYWIEAIGQREYGLLDPFWSSEWTYRMPITVDNTTGSDQTEFQMFFELDNTLTDFWSNVASDGADIRFVQKQNDFNLSSSTSLTDWYDSAWSDRVALTIGSGSINSALTDFPVYVDLSDLGADFFSKVKADGGDIRVTEADGLTEVPREIVSISPGTNTGEMYFKADTLSDTTNTTFYIYFGNSAVSDYAASDTYGSENVWINNFEAVYHLGEDPSGAGPQFIDSTSNGRNLTSEGGMTTAQSVAGQIGNAIDFDGVNDALRNATWSWGGGQLTASFWNNVATADVQPSNAFGFTNNGAERFAVDGPWDNSIFYWDYGTCCGDGRVQAPYGPYLDAWTHVNLVSTGVGNNFQGIYFDGGLAASKASSDEPNVTLTNFTIGGDVNGSVYHDGIIDEFRLSSVVRTADWIDAEYNNLNTPGSFYSVSAADGPLNWYSTSWNNRQIITIPGSQVDDSLVDFPVYLDLSLLGSDFHSLVATDGRDIRVTRGDGLTEVPYELVNIDTTLETGQLYFKANLSDVDDNNFYIYFDNEDAVAYERDDTYGSENVWTNGYRAVYHLEEGEVSTGNSNVYLDSTSNQFHGDDEILSSSKDGLFGRGQQFGVSQTDYISLPYQVMDGVGDSTLSWWHISTTTGDQTIISGANAGEDDELWTRLDNNTLVRMYYQGGQETFGLDGPTEYNDGTWQHFMLTAEDAIDSMNFYLNGVGDTENPDPQAVDVLDIDAGGLIIGQDQDVVGGNFNVNENFEGYLDELRFADVVRSAGWAATVYTNMNTPAVFMATSSVEALQPNLFTELDFWVQHFDYAGEEADIWVQIADLPAGGETTIWMYYGNGSSVSASDELATFSYSTSTEIYHVVDDSGADRISVVSLVDNNEVSLDGGAPVSLNAGERTFFTTFTGASTLSVLGPISGTVTNNAAGDGSETIVPISFASTTHAIPTSRGTEEYYVKSPFVTTSLQTFERATLRETVSVPVGTVATVNAGFPAGADAAVFRANDPVLVMHRSTDGGANDGVVAYPPTTRDLFGFDSNAYYLTSVENDAVTNTFCTGGDTGIENDIDNGEFQAGVNCSAGTQFSGDAVRLTGHATPITALQQADSDGTESTVFWPEMEFSTQYAITNDSQFIAVACSPRFGAVDIELRDAVGDVIGSGTCVPPNATAPGALRIGDPNTSGNQDTFYTGEHTVVSTNGVPFYLVFEDTDGVGTVEDEKNVVGTVQARKFNAINDDSVAFLPQEVVNDTEYNQLSFAWYENENQITPATYWSVGGGETVSEAQDITGAGAVENGDVIRLRMNILSSNATATKDTTPFELQYTTAAVNQCGSAVDWVPVGEVGSTTAAFSGFNNNTVADGTVLPTSVLASSTVLGTYEERNLSDFLPVDLAPGDVIEYDWVLEASDVLVNTNYCFRMVRVVGGAFTTYSVYPEVETVGPPDTPNNLLFFDNERTPASTVTLDFVANDIAGDDINYQVQVDDDYDFGSVLIDRNSDDDFIQFENINNPADKSPFNSGQPVRFTDSTTLVDGQTYWFRVRADDPAGSATTSDWSVPTSFTYDSSLVVTEWFQTTSDQFNTNTLSGLSTTSLADSVTLTASPATMTGTEIDFDDGSIGNAWGDVSWNDTVTSGTSTIQVQYNNNGNWELIPSADLPGNDIGTSTSPINLLDLNTATYNEIRLFATFEGATVSLQDWSVSWGLRVAIPDQGDLFDNQKTADTLPVFDFVSTDPQGDDLEYEISFSTDSTFESSSTTYNSDASAQFANSSNALDTAPFNSGDRIEFTTPGAAPFADGQTYWWRTRAKDPSGNNAWSPWSTPDSFTIDTAVTLSTWFQTTQAQFEQGALDGVTASTSNSVESSNDIGEYGTVTIANNNWTTINTQRTYVDMVVVASPEFDFNGTLNGRTARVRNKTNDSFEIKVDNYLGSFTGSTDVDYIVMEAGDWTIADGGTGVRMLAATAENINAKQAENYANGVTVLQNLSPSFGPNPGALAVISSDNDSDWIGSHVDGGGYQSSISSSQIGVSLAQSRNAASTHTGSEDIDYIVFDTTVGTNNGIHFQAANSLDVVTGEEVAVPITGFSAAPGVTVMHNNGDDGAQGGFAQKDTGGTNNASILTMSIAEQGPNADGHADNTVSFLAFEDSSGLIARFDSGSLLGTFAGEDIIFTDGSGPKYDNFSWNATEPGASEVVIQLQYEVSDGVYALIPDSEIPGNSVGTSSSPIDLTGVDVNIYATIRPLASLNCAATNCPTLDDWQLEWSEGVNMSGQVFEYNRVTPFGIDTWLAGGAWTNRTELTIPFTALQAELTDFPVYVDLGDLDATFWGAVATDGRDIRVTEADGLTEVPVELVGIDTVAETGELYFKPGTLSSTTDNVYYVYFNNPAATAPAAGSTYGSENVWTNNFEAVYHLEENPAGGGPQFADSTSNNRDLTAEGGITAGQSVAGQIGNAIDFDGVNDALRNVAWTWGGGEVTASFWNNVATADVQESNTFGFTNNGAERFSLDGPWIDSNFYWDYGTCCGDGRVQTPYGPYLDTWTHVNLVSTGAANTFQGIYLDGGLAASKAASDEPAVALNNFTIGGDVNGAVYHDGIIDEFRLSSVVRSADWIDAEYDNLNTPGSFYSVSATESQPASTGQIRAAVNGVVVSGFAPISSSDGTWTLSNVTAFNGDVVTAWIDGADEEDEAVATFIYDGLGDITGVALHKQHLSIQADEFGTVTNALLAQNDSTAIGDEDIFYEVDALNNLTVCGQGTCPNANFYVAPGQTYIPDGVTTVTVETHDFINNGTIELDTNVLNVSGSYENNSVSSIDASTINLTAETGAETITSTENPLAFHNLSFGSGAGNASFAIGTNLDLTGDLTVASGTLDRTGIAINLTGNLTTGGGGFWVGAGTTTFDGVGSQTWTDNNPVSQNVGSVVIDGVSVIVSTVGDVTAYDLTIGTNDTLVGGSDTIFVAGDWINNGTFNAETGTIEFVNDDRTYPPVIPGSSDWYSDVNFSDRIALVVDEDEVPADVATIPLFVDLSLLGSDFWSAVQTDGRDIRVTSGNGQTELPYDLVSIDTASQTGELHFLADSVSGSVPTTFYIYYNNASASAYGVTEPYGRNAVWADFEAVYHFEDDPTAISNVITDASGNGRDLLVIDAGLATTTGQLGTAIDFSVSAGALQDSSFTWQAGDTMKTSGWYQLSAAVNEAIWQFGTGSQPNLMFFEPWDNGTNRGNFAFGDNGSYTFAPRDTINYTHFTTIGVTSTAQSNLVYHDGILRETEAQTAANPSNTNANGFVVGRTGTTGSFTGTVDELRISVNNQSADWVTTEYNNQNDPETFFATSSVEMYVADLILDEATHNITAGGSAFNNLTFNDATTSPAFTEPSVVLTGDFTVATGTVSLPTGVLTVGGSFTNNGFFQHNNAEVEFTGTGAETVTLNGTPFFNALFDVTFDGSGTYTFTDTNATTTNNLAITDGSVVFPSGMLTVGSDFETNGGSFDPNGGTVIFSATDGADITTDSSSFNDVVFGGGLAGSNWLDLSWSDRGVVEIGPGTVSETLTNFPVYIDLATMDSEFWNEVKDDGADIRVTGADGQTEMPFELVSIDTVAETGELYFRADTVSYLATSTFYVYYGNSFANAYADTDPFGAQNVWSNDYLAVYHFEDEGQIGRDNVDEYTDSTANGYDAEDDTLATGTTGYIGDGVEIRPVNHINGVDSFDHLDLPIALMDGREEFTFTTWYQTNAPIGPDPTFVSAYGGENEVIIRVDNTIDMETFTNNSSSQGGQVSIAPIGDGVWRQFAYTYSDQANSDFAGYYFNGNEVYTDTDVNNGATLTVDPNGLIFGAEQDSLPQNSTGSGESLDGFVDEVRFAGVPRTAGWIAAEYTTLSDPASFYTMTNEALEDIAPVFTLNESNTDVDGDVTINGSQLVAPTSELTIGGSAFNTGGTYNPNNATTTFDSNDLGETVAFGEGAFWNLSFDGVGGGWSVATNTVNNNLTLVTGDSYTQAPNTTMTVEGVFSNSFASTSTTWLDSTLVLTGGDYEVTGRLDSGDDYATIEVSNDSDIVIWNSTINTSSILDTSSIYMPDHGLVDGELRIFGDYDRATGTEYWSYATDFDGTDISGSPRQVSVLIASSTTVTIESAFEMLGDANASTTVAGLTSGLYSLVASSSSLTAQFFNVSGTDAAGFQLVNGVTLGTFSDGAFAVADTTGLTIDAATIEAQPSTNYERFHFTSSAGSPSNVTLSGVPAGYWRFVNGSGDLYGEAFDNDDADPGAIQWDDSSFNITVSGRVRNFDGTEQGQSSICDGITSTIRLVVEGSTTYSATCDPTDGSYSISGVSFTGEPKLLAYVENDLYGASPADVALSGQTSGIASVVENGSLTVTRPAIADGDLLVAIVGKDNNNPVNPPAGWAEAAVSASTVGNARYAGIWYRAVTNAAAEPTEYYFFNGDTNTEDVSYWVGAFSNVELNNPFENIPTWYEEDGDTTPEAPEVLAERDGSYALAAWYVDSDGGITMPGGVWTTLQSNIVAGGNNLSVVGQLMNPAGSTTEAVATGLGGGDDTTTGQFVLRRRETGGAIAYAATVSKTPIGAPLSPVYNQIVRGDTQTGTGVVPGNADITVTRPAVVNDGDVLVAIVARDDDFTVTAQDAGWVEENSVTTDSADDRHASLWYKIVTDASSEPASYAFRSNDTGGEEYSYFIGAFSNVDTSDVFTAASVWNIVDNDASPTLAGVNVTAGSYVLGAWATVPDANAIWSNPEWTVLADNVVTNDRMLLNVVGQMSTTTQTTQNLTITGINGGDDSLTGLFVMNPTVQSVPDRIENFDLYENMVVVRHEDIAPLTIADMTLFDNDDENDILFTASTSTVPATLNLLPGIGLYVFGNKEFAPAGVVTLEGGGNTVADGSLYIGPNATYTSTSTNALTIGGSHYVDTAGVFDGAESVVTFTATNTAQIGAAASSTITYHDMVFNGVGGSWVVGTPIVSTNDIAVNAGTVAGISDITVATGAFTGDGLVDMTGGIVEISTGGMIGGVNGWSFNNLVLGDGLAPHVFSRATNATTTVRDTLTISTASFLDAYGSAWDMQGDGTPLVVNGSFIQGTSTVQYSGTNVTITQTPYYNLLIDPVATSTTALAPVTGLQVFGGLAVGLTGTSTLDINTSDPLVAVVGDLYIGTDGTVAASDSSLLDLFGGYHNDGVFQANGGTVEFLSATGTVTVAAGDSSFANALVIGAGDFNFTESATTTESFNLNAGGFTLASGETLAVGGTFTNQLSDIATDWTNTTLRLFGGQTYMINNSAGSDTYHDIVIVGNTQPRVWNANINTVTTESGSSLYSMDHAAVDGELRIYGDLVSSSFNDHWSHDTDFDGTSLAINRPANVLIEAGGSVLYTGGSLTVSAPVTATTTITALTAGTYDFTLGGTTTVDLAGYSFRDTTADGLVISGTPTITSLDRGDFEVAIAGGSAMTVGSTAIDTNPAQEYNFIRFATTTPISAFNVTATGTSVSAWRFVNTFGNLPGEANDVDPGGDPGYITWEDSAAIINISGSVFSDEGTTVSAVCDGVTDNIRLSVNGSTFFDTTCDAGTGAYAFIGINYGLGNTLTVYIDDEVEDAVAVTQDPISSIANLDLYENRVIVKHEGSDAMTIADMGTWDSDDDADILFDVESAGTDTIVFAADTKLIVADTKEFAPGGNVTIPGGGSGASFDGTLELGTNASFTGSDTAEYTIGGSLLAGAGAVWDAALSTTTFTTTGAGRTIDTNEGGFHNVSFTGAGDWSITDPTTTISNDLTKTGGALSLSVGTTTIGGSFVNTSGTFDANDGALVFTATDSGNQVELGGSDAHEMRFTGTGNWSMIDANATTTASFSVEAGTVTLPSGVFTVAEDFVNTGTILNNAGTLRLTGTSGGNTLTTSGSDLNNVTIIAGAGDYTQTDVSIALSGDLLIQSGTFTTGTGTLAIGGSFDASLGTFDSNAGSVLFNAATPGHVIDAGVNEFTNVRIAGTGGGWTMVSNATTTNNFSLDLSATDSFTLSSGATLYVGGVFENTRGGANTTWSGSTLILDGANEYEVSPKTVGVEQYDTVILGENTDISIWNSSATTTTVPASSSFYSQDNAGVDGDLYIYGDYHIGTTTEYWNATTDFDGTSLGVARAVTVAIASSSNISVDGGALNLIGVAGATTTVTNQGLGTYGFAVSDGAFAAEYYAFRNLDANGLVLSNTPTISSLSRGDFEQADNGVDLITLATDTLIANASLVITDTRFDTGGFTSGTNVNLAATTTNSWTFTGAIGDLWGEAFDVDGTDQCSSIRWDDSDCLLTEQTAYRWRNDDGGEGAIPGSWYDNAWDKRQRVRVINRDNQTYTNVAVKLNVPYDADMQGDFEDLRFTDADGVTLINHWQERFTSASEADVWVQIPTLAPDAVTEIYMYYDNITATSSSNGTAVFNAIDDFDDNNITEYSGDLSLFDTGSAYAFGGGFGLDASPNTSARATDGIARDDITVSQGEIIRYMQFINLPAGSGDEVCTLFGVQGPVANFANNQNYGICLSPLRNRVTINRDVVSTDTTGIQLVAEDVTLTGGWYEVEVDWETNDDITVSVFDVAGNLAVATTTNDSTYTSGGIGFTFWFQNGGWDSYTVRPRTDSAPVVQFGAEQLDGGATFAAAQDTPTGGFEFGDVARLRIGIENTGLDITNQNFELEVAPKGAAPVCEAVSVGDFAPVPNAASCGSSEVCMIASANVANGDATSDHLVTDAGQFVPGEIVADTANETGNLDVNQNQYTELEYAITLTTNAVNDAYCFRVTNDGTDLDSYAIIPELTLAFDPVLDPVILNDGLDIALSPGTTTSITASTTVSDFNGFADLAAATTTFYKTSVGAACTPNDNNCYVASGSACSFTNCTGSSCSLICTADFQFHADPTDIDGAEEWFAFMEVEDVSGGIDFETSIGTELLTLRALEVVNAIGYGAIDTNQNTGTFNPDITLNNLGNESIDVQVAGTDMTDGVASVIPAALQRYATTTFDYAACIGCQALSVTGDDVEVDLNKPLTSTPLVSDQIYWGISVPFGTASNPHNGVNTFTAISD